MPSCIQEKRKASISLKNIVISGNQEDFLADFAEMIIPKTSTPGAKDISSHIFALMMVDDCYAPEVQKKFMNGLNQFESIAKSRFGTSFSKCSQPEKVELLKAMEGKAGIPDETLLFYNSMKRLTIQSFTTSQYYLTNIHVYELVPSRFHGCVAVTK
jgi:hypothetical protein